MDTSIPITSLVISNTIQKSLLKVLCENCLELKKKLETQTRHYKNLSSQVINKICSEDILETQHDDQISEFVKALQTKLKGPVLKQLEEIKGLSSNYYSIDSSRLDEFRS